MRVLCIVLMALLLLSANISAADKPLDPGCVILGGSAYFSAQVGDAYTDTKQLSIAPSAAFFISGGGFVGGQFQLSYLDREYSDRTEFFIGPVAGYYFNRSEDAKDIKGDIYPFMMGFFGIGGISSGPSIYQFGFSAGMTLMLSDAVGLDFSVVISDDIYSYDFGGSVNGVTMMAGMGFTSFIY